MAEHDNLRVIESEVNAFNARDWAAYLRCFAESVVTFEPDEGDPILGRDGLRKRVNAYLSAFPDVQLETERLFGSGEWVCLNSLFIGTHSGTLTGPGGTPVGPTGNKVRVHGCSVFKIANQEITEFIGYYDQLELMTQLGIDMRPSPK